MSPGARCWDPGCDGCADDPSGSRCDHARGSLADVPSSRAVHRPAPAARGTEQRASRADALALPGPDRDPAPLPVEHEPEPEPEPPPPLRGTATTTTRLTRYASGALLPALQTQPRCAAGGYAHDARCYLQRGHYRAPWAHGGGDPHRAPGGRVWYGSHERLEPGAAP